MKRAVMLQRLGAQTSWDVLIIGGGASGLGCAVDAASRGYRTLLVEQSDFAKGTSSRSTKLAHGGVRYLRRGNVRLVAEALQERGRLQRNAPHLVHDLRFLVPAYAWWDGPFYSAGLGLYDVLAGGRRAGRSRYLPRSATLRLMPTIEPRGLRGGILYSDGQFDDARLAINLAQTAAAHGATLINYCRLIQFTRTGGNIDGAIVEDVETGQRYQPRARAIINATGAWSDQVRRLDDASATSRVVPSQGSHIVLDRRFLPGDTALMIPRTDDGRVLFAIPWEGRVVIGTTDIAAAETPLEPRPMRAEIDFLLAHASRYLTGNPQPSDVLSAFAGLRPLAAGAQGTVTGALSRDHALHVSAGGLISLTGGKWTTYRKMAEDTIDRAQDVAGLGRRRCRTHDLPIHGHCDRCDSAATAAGLARYGTDAPALLDLMRTDPRYAQPLHPRLPYRLGEVVWAVRHEMARTVEDVLSRRTRAVVLDARAAMDAAPAVAAVMAAELNAPPGWADAQMAAFSAIAANHLPDTLG